MSFLRIQLKGGKGGLLYGMKLDLWVLGKRYSYSAWAFSGVYVSLYRLLMWRGGPPIFEKLNKLWFDVKEMRRSINVRRTLSCDTVEKKGRLEE